jgi:hypothetical protein
MNRFLLTILFLSLVIAFSCDEEPDAPPTISVVSPQIANVLHGLIELVIDATDDHHVENVQLYFDNVLIGSDDTEPYSFFLDLNKYSTGTHVLKITAYDDKHQLTTKETIVIVDNPVPSVSIVSPSSGVKLAGTKAFVVEASDDDSVVKVELFVDNVLVGSDEISPYNFTVDFTSYNPGLHTVKAVATDKSGTTSKHEITIEVAKINLLDRPSNFTASKGTYGTKIGIQWSAVSGGITYDIYRKKPGDVDYSHLAYTTSRSFSDEDVASPLLNYYYKVRVYNNEFEYSAFSDADFGFKQKYQLVTSFGEQGSSPNQFSFVALISMDNAGILYLADDYNIKKYTSAGEFLGLFKSTGDTQAPLFVGNRVVTSANYNLVIEENNSVIANIPTGMNIVGQFATDGSNIYVAVNYNPAEGYNHHKIYKYDLNGNLLTSFGSKGSQPGQFNEPWGVSFYQDQIIVTSQLGKKAVFFTTSGQFVKEIDFSGIANITYGNFVKDGWLYVAAGAFVIKTDLQGNGMEKIGEGMLSSATSVVVDDSGNVIVAEPYQRKIRVFHQ